MEYVSLFVQRAVLEATDELNRAVPVFYLYISVRLSRSAAQFGESGGDANFFWRIESFSWGTSSGRFITPVTRGTPRSAREGNIFAPPQPVLIPFPFPFRRPSESAWVRDGGLGLAFISLP